MTGGREGKIHGAYTCFCMARMKKGGCFSWAETYHPEMLSSMWVDETGGTRGVAHYIASVNRDSFQEPVGHP
jgi:hypothetical protein